MTIYNQTRDSANYANHNLRSGWITISGSLSTLEEAAAFSRVRLQRELGEAGEYPLVSLILVVALNPRFPDRALLPTFCKAHSAKLVGGTGIQQIEQSVTPGSARRNFLQEVAQYRQNATDIVGSDLEWIMPSRMFLPGGNSGPCANASIPEPAVMGANVARGIQRDEPGS